MREFVRRMQPSAAMRILDLGGTPAVWEFIPGRLDITVVNLPGETGAHMPSRHELRFVEGDACHLPQYRDGSFDLVFSNSVIEHVGDEARQEAFAREVRRLGRSYWIQTPSIWFPVEAHTAMPLWWFYPPRLRRFFLDHWRRSLPAWSDSMAATRVLARRRMEMLFPDAAIYVERFAAIPKSYAAYRSPSL